MGRSTRLLWVAFFVLLTGCAPLGRPGDAGLGNARNGPPKILTIGLLREPATIEGFTGEGGTAGGASEVRHIIHNHLTNQDPRDVVLPELAVDLPEVEKGTWRVNADGSMDMTWRIRPGVKWHDGAPFTSADLEFSFQLHKDPDLAHAYGAFTRAMESAAAPDPHTFVVHWRTVNVRADEARGLTPLPRHLLEDLYRTDKEAFIHSPRFTTEFVGLGPYRMLKWDQSSHLELGRFDGYYRSRPPLDGIVIRFIFDPNSLVANILAGAVDLILPPSIDVDAAVEVKRRWEGTGNLVRIETVPRITYFELQFRPEFARPAQGIPNRTVREALYRAINRTGLAEVNAHGLAPIADSWHSPTDPLRPELEAWIPQYPHDLVRAQQLLAEEGWVRAPDGLLTHQQTGERFEIEIWSIPQVGEKPAAVIADDWKAVGADARIYAIPTARAQDREHHSRFPSVLMTGTFIDQMPDRLNSRDVATPANRWSGRNRGGYTNPRADTLLDLTKTTVDRREQIQVRREQVQEVMGDLAFMPLHWELRPILMLRSVKGDIHPYNPGWNSFEWDKVN